jgi:NADH:ubiquinone oxidoreductase subunit 5 (subunit L)/multisubunit Na+/H+ antiporter MnhA subunit
MSIAIFAAALWTAAFSYVIFFTSFLSKPPHEYTKNRHIAKTILTISYAASIIANVPIMFFVGGFAFASGMISEIRSEYRASKKDIEDAGNRP